MGAFTTYRNTPGGPMAHVTNVSSATYLLRSTFYVLQTLLGDSCLVRKYHHTITHRYVVHDTISQIYRCSVVWQHNIWIIILPILLWISCAGKWATLWIRNRGWRTCSNSVTGVGFIISYSRASESPELAQVFSFTGWVAAFLAATLATSVICTCTSSYRYFILLLTLCIQPWSRSVSGLSIGPVGSIVNQRARSSPC